MERLLRPVEVQGVASYLKRFEGDDVLFATVGGDVTREGVASLTLLAAEWTNPSLLLPCHTVPS